MKKTGKLTKQAISVANQIEKQYGLLTIENSNFFDQYHDDLQIQKSCSWEAVEEVQAYEDKGHTPYAKSALNDLSATLKYCKAVIALQKQTNKLPKSIYG